MIISSYIAQPEPLTSGSNRTVYTSDSRKLCRRSAGAMLSTNCVPSCKYRGRDEGDVVWCCLCVAWFHEDCVNITEGGSGPECRLTSTRVVGLTNMVSQLLDLVDELNDRIRENETDTVEVTSDKGDATVTLQPLPGPQQKVGSLTTAKTTEPTETLRHQAPKMCCRDRVEWEQHLTPWPLFNPRHYVIRHRRCAAEIVLSGNNTSHPGPSSTRDTTS